MNRSILRVAPAIAAAIAAAACERPAPPPAPAPIPAPTREPAADLIDQDAYAILLPPMGPGIPSKGAIIDGEWLWDTPTGAGWTAAPLPAPEPVGKGRRYRFEHVSLTIEPGACPHSSLRPAFPDAVSVTGGYSDRSGCGGPRRAPVGVADTHWQVMRLRERAAPKSGRPTILAFAKDGSVGGTHSCNDVGIGARWVEGGFAHPEGEPWIEGTAVGCQGLDVEFGDRFWSAMHEARSWHRRGDRLRIVFADGGDAELRLIL